MSLFVSDVRYDNPWNGTSYETGLNDIGRVWQYGVSASSVSSAFAALTGSFSNAFVGNLITRGADDIV